MSKAMQLKARINNLANENKIPAQAVLQTLNAGTFVGKNLNIKI